MQATSVRHASSLGRGRGRRGGNRRGLRGSHRMLFGLAATKRKREKQHEQPSQQHILGELGNDANCRSHRPASQITSPRVSGPDIDCASIQLTSVSTCSARKKRTSCTGRMICGHVGELARTWPWCSERRKAASKPLSELQNGSANFEKPCFNSALEAASNFEKLQ